MQKRLLAIAVGLGWLIAYVDSRPAWADTVVTVFACLVIRGVPRSWGAPLDRPSGMG